MNTLQTFFTLQVNLEKMTMNLEFQKLRRFFIKVKYYFINFIKIIYKYLI